jgi:hypothetical protein
VVWDHAFLQRMVPYLDTWHARPTAGPIWDFSYQQLTREFKAIADELGLESIVPYALRHTGASMDALNGWRPLGTIQKRGRWRCHKSVARYEKAGRVGLGYGKIRKPVRRWLEACAAGLASFLHRPTLSPPAPVF